MARRTSPRGRLAATAAKVVGGLAVLYLVGWAVTVLFGIQVLPGVLLPRVGSDVVRPSPEVTVAEGIDAGVAWRLTVNMVGRKPCMNSYMDAGANPGQCGFRDFPQFPEYSPSVALINSQPFLRFGPLPPRTATVVINWSDGTQQRVAAQTDPVSKVTYFYLLSDKNAQDFQLLDASGHEVPV